jgi:hypothetical protein
LLPVPAVSDDVTAAADSIAATGNDNEDEDEDDDSDGDAASPAPPAAFPAAAASAARRELADAESPAEALAAACGAPLSTLGAGLDGPAAGPEMVESAAAEMVESAAADDGAGSSSSAQLARGLPTRSPLLLVTY